LAAVGLGRALEVSANKIVSQISPESTELRCGGYIAVRPMNSSTVYYRDSMSLAP